MKFTSTFIALAAAALAPHLAYAAPARWTKRSEADVLVLTFADVLEQLESSFYAAALQKYQDSDFTAAGYTSSAVIAEQVKIISVDESTHSTVLQTALKEFGASPITSCKFNFDSALTDVNTMAAVARVVETVGVSAYLGGAQLITDPVVLVSAAQILTVEARHSTILNILAGGGTAVPTAFDLALKPQEVLALAAPFFDGPCDLGIPANPTLTVTNTGTVQPGTLLTFQSAAMNGTVSEDSLFCQMMLPGQPMSIPLPLNQCVVPQGINGPVYIFVTSDGQPLANNVRDRATTQLVAGPTLAYIDTQPETIGRLVRGDGGSSPSSSSSSSDPASSNNGSADPAATTSTSTATISPAEASSVIGSASAAQPTANGAASNPAANTTPGQPNTFEGKSPDGAVTVNGWTNIN